MSDKSDHSKSWSTNPKESNGKEPSIRSKPDSVIEEGSSSQKVGSPKDVDNWSHVSTIDGRGLSEKGSKKPPPSTSTFKQNEKSEASEKGEKSDKSLSVISALSSGVDESTTIKSAHKSDLSVEHFIDDSSESAENGSVSNPKSTKKPKVEPVRKSSPQKVKTPKTPIQQQSPRPINKKEPVKAILNKSVTPKAQTKSKNIVSVKSSPKPSSKGKSMSKPSGKPSSTSPSVSLINSPTDGGLHQQPNLLALVTDTQVLSPTVRVSRFVAQPSPPFPQSNPFIMYWNESVAGPIPSHNFLAPKSAILVCRVLNCAQGHASLLTVNFQQYAFYILVDHQQTNKVANPQTQASAQPEKQQQQPSSVKSSKNRKEYPKSPTSTSK